MFKKLGLQKRGLEKLGLGKCAMLTTVLLFSACAHMQGAGNVAKPQVMTMGETVQLQVAARRVACQSTVPMQCLLVTDVATNRHFQIWYNAIDGFTHANGFNYVINAKPLSGVQTQDPSSQQWSLVNVVSQTPN